MESLCVCVAVLPVSVHLLLGTGLDFSLWAIQHPSKMPGGFDDGLSARIKSACFKGCFMRHVSPSRQLCDSF